MKQSSQYFTPLLVLFLLLLISSSKLNASFLETKQYGVKELSTATEEASPEHNNLESSESIYELMGLEKCDDIIDNEEECLKRRLISEAHLDYIYTQHHKP